ncbi:hypothetical protein CRENBAI_017146 [Crenichthys baileyi]|uniref:Uncharacterized protein n=1 Tax=Crenichthys baileyi TaxID=28760 RepID=A0AAV9RXF5_9TELE
MAFLCLTVPGSRCRPAAPSACNGIQVFHPLTAPPCPCPRPCPPPFEVERVDGWPDRVRERNARALQSPGVLPAGPQRSANNPRMFPPSPLEDFSRCFERLQRVLHTDPSSLQTGVAYPRVPFPCTV